MSVAAYCGAALCALVAVLVLKGQRSEFAATLSLATALLLLGVGVTRLLPSLAQIREALEGSTFSRCTEPIFKALGITLAVQLASGICRDAGEGSIAEKLELIGRAELLLLAIPLLGELIELARGLLA